MSPWEWLLTLPQLVASLLVVLVMVLVGLGATALVDRLADPETLERHNDVAGFVFATLGVIYGVMMALVALEVWESYATADEALAGESALAYALYRDLSGYPDPVQAAPALDALEQFVVSVVERDFPAMRAQQWASAREIDAETRARFEQLWTTVSSINPTTPQEQHIYDDIREDVTRIGEERVLRIGRAEEDLPEVVWRAAVLGGIIVVAFPALFGTPNRRAKYLMVAANAVMVSLVLMVVIHLNHPFSGPVAIAPDGYEDLIDLAGWGTGK